MDGGGLFLFNSTKNRQPRYNTTARYPPKNLVFPFRFFFWGPLCSLSLSLSLPPFAFLPSLSILFLCLTSTLLHYNASRHRSPPKIVSAVLDFDALFSTAWHTWLLLVLPSRVACGSFTQVNRRPIGEAVRSREILLTSRQLWWTWRDDACCATTTVCDL